MALERREWLRLDIGRGAEEHTGVMMIQSLAMREMAGVGRRQRLAGAPVANWCAWRPRRTPRIEPSRTHSYKRPGILARSWKMVAITTLPRMDWNAIQ
jgi:hypothetical protein